MGKPLLRLFRLEAWESKRVSCVFLIAKSTQAEKNQENSVVGTKGEQTCGLQVGRSIEDAHMLTSHARAKALLRTYRI